MLRMRALAAVLLVAVSACDKKTPPPAPTPTPTPGNPSDGVTITGRERIGWDQTAANPSDVATFRYAIYVDGARSELADASCATTAESAGFPCSAPLPSMSAGSHTIQLAAYIPGNPNIEGERSVALRVTVQAATIAQTASSSPSTSESTTHDGVRLSARWLRNGFADAVDVAAAPDGRVFVADRRGTIHVIDELGGLLTSSPAAVDDGEMLAIALDSEFSRTHLLYAVYRAVERDRWVYRLARYREVQGRIGERAVLMNEVAIAGAEASASLRVAVDGRVLLAVASRSGRGGATAGKLLRLESDGSAPPEQNGSRVIVAGLERPVGVAWDAARSSVWVLDGGADSAALWSITVAAPEGPRARLDRPLVRAEAGAIAVYQGGMFEAFAGDLFVASEEARCILRVRPASGSRPPERLLQDLAAGIRSLTVAADGAIFFITADALGKIVQTPLR